MDLAYTSIQAVREGAGLQKRFTAQSLTGAVDGVNRVFVAGRKPLVDNNDDGLVNASDVVLYVNGLPVSVTSVAAVSGAITASVAPAAGATVTADYSTSPVSDSQVHDLIIEAQSWVDKKIGKVVALPYADLDSVPGVVKTAARLYAAALALVRDYGATADTEQTSKDGNAKIQLARTLLDDFIQGESDVVSDDNHKAASKTDGNIFERITDLDNQYGGVEQDEAFFRREGY